jgi:aryl-alcohol dehydrogenase-like predicted oxidoreductase
MSTDRVATVPLGDTEIRITPIGLGTWQWGDRMIWGFGRGYGEADIQAAFFASIEAGMDWVDTAEVYGNGRSERYLGAFLRQATVPIILATKFMPYPWRLRRADLLKAARGSLRRLGVDHIDLYQIHHPLPPVPIRNWIQALAEAHREGLVRAVGVSNYSTRQMLDAQDELARHGLPLASNQVRFSLLDRGPERTGLLAACRQRGITLIAYSPLAQGWLTGKYMPGKGPGGVRGLMSRTRVGDRLPPLLALLRQIGEAHGGRTPAQVALNWVLAKGAVAIPGAKGGAQAEENAGALGWSLTAAEVELLDGLTA